jgi:ACR3 family arsenite transporter
MNDKNENNGVAIRGESACAENENACCPPGVVENGECSFANNEEETITTADPIAAAPKINLFAKYLTVWIALAMIVGTAIGALVPSIPDALEKATISNVWIPGSVLVWLMVYPMMLAVRWNAIRQVHTKPRGLLLTTFVNWAVQPFIMYGLAVLFFNVVYGSVLDAETQSEYIAGAVILGGSPCTAMVFVWSSLAGGDANYTLVQVVLNDIILLFLYAPTTKLLLNISDIALPWGTIFLSVALFVVVPFALGMLTHLVVLRRENGEELMHRIQKLFEPVSAVSLVLLVVFIFISQAKAIVDNPTHVLLIMVPLLLQTSVIFVLSYGLAYFFCLEHNVAGPAAFIGSSNFFELAVALALTVYGPESGAVLVTVVGVLVEVPVMLLEVAIVNSTKQRYERHLADEKCRCNKDD